MRKHNFLPLLTALVGVTSLLTACGDRPFGRLGSSPVNLAELSDDDRLAGEQMLFIYEGQADGATTTSCAAKRTKLFAERELVKAGSDHSNLEATEEHSRLVQNLNTYNKASCSEADGRAECVALRTKLAADVEKVTKTPEWTVLTKNSNFKSVASDYAAAVAEGCIAAKAI